MKKLLTVGLLIAASFTVNAQINLKNAASTISKGEAAVKTAENGLNASSVLTTLANGIQPSAFTSGWSSAKSGWLSSASKVTTASAAGSLLSKLVGFIKPTAFKSGFVSKISSVAQTAKTVSSLGSLGSTASTVVSGLKTSSLTSDFANNKDSFVSALSLLK